MAARASSRSTSPVPESGTANNRSDEHRSVIKVRLTDLREAVFDLKRRYNYDNRIGYNAEHDPEDHPPDLTVISALDCVREILAEFIDLERLDPSQVLDLRDRLTMVALGYWQIACGGVELRDTKPSVLPLLAEEA